MKRLFILILLILFASQAYAKTPIRTVEGIVVKVSDGDTVTLNAEGTKLKVRLYGIDAPETPKPRKPGQPYGEEAYKALESKVLGKNVSIDIIAVDRYKRMVSIIWLNRRDINQEMVAEGWAWAYKQYLQGPYASEYIKAEDEARRKKLGIWRQTNPQPPWEFRKQIKMR